MYRVRFKQNGKYYMFDFDRQKDALIFFNELRKNKNNSEITYKVLLRG